MENQIIKIGSKVSIVHRLALTDDSEVDSSTVQDQFIFTVGDGALFPALEELILGLSVEAEESFIIAAEYGFGAVDSTQIHSIPMDTFEQQFEDTAEIAAGVVIYFESPAGDEVPATIVSVEGSEVMVDFNHPLAGRDLKFEVKVISIED